MQKNKSTISIFSIVRHTVTAGLMSRHYGWLRTQGRTFVFYTNDIQCFPRDPSQQPPKCGQYSSALPDVQYLGTAVDEKHSQYENSSLPLLNPSNPCGAHASLPATHYTHDCRQLTWRCKWTDWDVWRKNSVYINIFPYQEEMKSSNASYLLCRHNPQGPGDPLDCDQHQQRCSPGIYKPDQKHQSHRCSDGNFGSFSIAASFLLLLYS